MFRVLGLWGCGQFGKAEAPLPCGLRGFRVEGLEA